MNNTLSKRAQRIKPSPTLAVAARAEAMQKAGRDIINLGVGEPDFDTPDHIKKAAIQAIQQGFTKYTAVDGTASLKQAIIQKFQRENGLTYQPDQILVSCGAKHSIYNLFASLLNTGDEVIIPAPYWVSYPDMVKLCDAEPVIIEAGFAQNFKITPEQLQQAITPKTRLIVLNSPSNPTGAAYTQAELKALGEVLNTHSHVYLITDDIYEHTQWNHLPFSNIVMANPVLYDRTIVVNGVSKAYAMTGWRIGYAGGPKKIIAAMKKMQSQVTSNPTSIAQIAAEAALNGDINCVKKMCVSYKERHDFVLKELQSMPGVRCLPADGTFYIFPSIQDLLSKPMLANDIEFAEYLLNEADIALVPGSAFGAPGHIRISYATSIENLKRAMKNLREFILSIK